MSRPASDLRSLLRLAGPLAAVHAGNQLMGFIDTAIVGRLGATELAGVGLANSVLFAIAVLGIGMMLGLDPQIAQAIGAGDPARARRLMWQGVWVGILAGLAVSVPMLGAAVALGHAGVEPAVAEQARIYLLLRIPGIVPLLVYFGLRSYLQALGRTRPMVIATVAGNLLNAPVTWLLVFGGEGIGLPGIPQLGAAGAAIATVLATCLQLGVLALAIAQVEAPVVDRRLQRAEAAVTVRLGVPIGLQMGAEIGVFALVGLLAARIGAAEMAAHQIALTLASLTFCVAIGIASAGSTLVGRAIGAGDTPAARRAGFTSYATGAAFMGLCALAFIAAPAAFARILTDQPEVIAAALPLLVVAGFFQISDGAQAVGAGVLRGAGDTRFAFVANLVGHYAVGLPIAIVLGMRAGLGVPGLWWGLCAGLTAVAAALAVRFHRLSAVEIRPIAAQGAPQA